ncbi:MAG TPA: hypothetical protein EYQ50_10080 [Verrucomicrobiales bacterium]|nr:hypothetical protein [Verrucomicrobiales bacterium]
MTRWLNPRLKAIDLELEEKRSLRESLPLTEPSHRGSSRGFHSLVGLEIGSDSAFSIDWAEPYGIDAVALFPVHVEAPFSGVGTYGLPRSIRLEWFAPDEETPIKSETFSDPDPRQNRRGFPLYLPVKDVIASRLRIVVVEPWQSGESRLWALSEVMVLSGARNIAAGRSVEFESGGQAIIPDIWFPTALTDANSPLGPPVVPDPSPTNGFLCNHTENPEETKWMQIDLGKRVSVDEVRLFPSRPTDFLDLPGTGFPIRFRVEVDDDPGFNDPVVIFRTEDEDFPNPGDSPVVLTADGASARYVRLTATRLCPFVRGFSFSLAEMEVWSQDRNLAAGAPVSASDVFADPRYPRWKPEYLVDGYTSRNRIVPYSDWVAGLTRRRLINREIANLESEAVTANEQVARGAVQAGGGLLILAGLLGTAFLRSLRARRLETARLREQIARDLHDHVGSNLGGIVLLAESLADGGELQEKVREEILEIRDVADATSQSMRDIVWLIQDGDTSLGALMLHLKETARQMLTGLDLEIEVRPRPLPNQTLSLQIRRHVYLAFKEALHNVRKHADASQVRIGIDVDVRGEQITFQVQDDGCGFHSGMPSSGHGLENLEKRAEALGGSFAVESSPGRGCLICFSGTLARS